MNKNITKHTETDERFVLVPQAQIESLVENQKKILAYLEKGQPPNLTGNYVSEEEAKKEFSKGTTWFWERRKTGELPFVKVGGKVYYNKEDLLQLFEKANR